MALRRSSTATEQMDHEHHDGDHQNNVDEAAGDVQAEAENPQNEQNCCNLPKHNFSLFESSFNFTESIIGRHAGVVMANVTATLNPHGDLVKKFAQ